jgi:hypothetical protein
MKVIKKDGTIEQFDGQKIVTQSVSLPPVQ